MGQGENAGLRGHSEVLTIFGRALNARPISFPDYLSRKPRHKRNCVENMNSESGVPIGEVRKSTLRDVGTSHHDRRSRTHASKAATRNADTQRKLLDAARVLFTSRGYEKTGTREIVRHAGVGLGTFYLYFDSKFDCFRAIAQQAADELGELTRKRSLPAESFHDIMAGFVGPAFDYASVNPALFAAVTSRQARRASVGQSGHRHWTDFRLSLIERWKQEGHIDKRWDSKTLSHLILGLASQGGGIVSRDASRKDDVEKNVLLFLSRGLENFDLGNELCRQSPRVHGGAEISRREKEQERRAQFSKRARTQKKIIIAARTLFSEREYHEVSCEEIAVSAGISIGTFYLYFNDRLDCFLAFVNDTLDEIFDLIAHDINTIEEGSERLYVFLRRFFDYSEKNPGLLRNILLDASVLSSEAKSRTSRGASQTSALIQSWKEQGHIDPAFDARILFHILLGVLYQANLFAENQPQRREIIIENALRFMLCGIVKR